MVVDLFPRSITEIVEEMAPGLAAAEYGLGYLSAAQILLW